MTIRPLDAIVRQLSQVELSIGQRVVRLGHFMVTVADAVVESDHRGHVGFLQRELSKLVEFCACTAVLILAMSREDAEPIGTLLRPCIYARSSV